MIETKDQAPAHPDHGTKPLQQAREDFERDDILQVLSENNRKVGDTARVLHIDRANLYRKMRGLGISTNY